MKTYAGIDLHSSNNFIGVINQKDERLHCRRHDNNLDTVLKVLKKYKKSLQGVVVESTYNWYWLVDGLMDHGFKVHLANPAAIQQYKGLKNRDDKWDAFWLAHLLRLGILAQGYIYPKQKRSIRDMFRRRTTQILSLQSMISRNRGVEQSASAIVRFHDDFIEQMFDCPHLVSTALHQTEKRKGTTTEKTVIATLPGRMWKQPITTKEVALKHENLSSARRPKRIIQ